MVLRIEMMQSHFLVFIWVLFSKDAGRITPGGYKLVYDVVKALAINMSDTATHEVYRMKIGKSPL